MSQPYSLLLSYSLVQGLFLKLPAENFARHALRDGVDEHHAARQLLVRRHLPGHEVADVPLSYGLCKHL